VVAAYGQSEEVHGRLHGAGASATCRSKAEAAQHPPSVLERFLSHPVGDIGISSITVAELDYGVSKSRHAVKNRLALAQFLSPLEVASFDRAAAAYGRLRATLEQKGTPIGSMDLLIAAHALSLAVRLVTNNAREFRRVPGLRVENWV